MSHSSVYFSLGKLSGKHEADRLKRELDTLPGIMSVSVNRAGDSVAVDYDATGSTQNDIQRKIEGLGFHVDGISAETLTD